MKAEIRKLLDVLEETPQFTIPIFQRRYSWTDKNCLQLLDDVLRCGANGKTVEHFTGIIVFSPTSVDHYADDVSRENLDVMEKAGANFSTSEADSSNVSTNIDNGTMGHLTTSGRELPSVIGAQKGSNPHGFYAFNSDINITEEDIDLPYRFENVAPNALNIIDGQQRITTVILLLEALIGEMTSRDITIGGLTPEDINSKYTRYNGEEFYTKILLLEKDQEYLEDIVINASYEQKSHERVYANYELFVKELEKLSNDELLTLFNGLQKLTVVDMRLNEHNNPQIIFDGMNSTGLDLTKSDRVRNFILMGLDKKTQEDFYRKYWQPIEESFGTNYSKDFDTFIWSFLKIEYARMIQFAVGGKRNSHATSTHVEEANPKNSVGIDPTNGQHIILKYWKHGYYLDSDGVTAALPKGLAPNDLTFEHALELLDVKRFKLAKKEKTIGRANITLSSTPKKDEIYDAFKIYYELNGGDSEAVLIEMAKFADCNNAIKYKTKVKEEDEDEAILVPIFDLIVRKMKNEIILPIVLMLYYEYKYESTLTLQQLIYCLKLVESYYVRRHFCGYPASNMNEGFIALMNKLYGDVKTHPKGKNSYYELFIKELTQKNVPSREFPDDSKFAEALTERDISPILVKYLLSKIENHDNPSPVNIIGQSNISIEHVLPQGENLPKEWQEMLGENWQLIQSKNVNKLGNLTLTENNSAYSNKDFYEKLYYKNSSGESMGLSSSKYPNLDKEFHTKPKNPKWTGQQIKARSERLAKIAVKAFINKPNVNNIPYLDEKPTNASTSIASTSNVFNGGNIAATSKMLEKLILKGELKPCNLSPENPEKFGHIEAELQQNGNLKIGTREFTSATEAARAVEKTFDQMSIKSGWDFWGIVAPDGTWIPLATLKSKLFED